MSTVTVAAIQITSTPEKTENYKKVAHFCQKAAEKGAQLVVLPEHWEWLGDPEAKMANAEPIPGPSIQFLQALAKQYRFVLISGSTNEQNGKKSPFNTLTVVHADGNLGKIYRKIHLFDADLLPGFKKESDFTSSGDQVVVEQLEWGKIGCSICYDLRFPELYRQLASKGVDIILVPANFTAVTGVPHWEVLLRSRAIENQCFVIAADQTGMTGIGWEAHGHSMIVNPWGEVLAIAGREEGVITADIPFDQVAEIRRKMPVHHHRKLF